ncbi:response regulator transcription factor [Hazenella sp. IB182357]|uniref:Response regulator transcription factor n=1 Tax=Polycladospora coralii TaxID=2771432 RepID=A0A926NA61_9BACL|nr:response regulator transcription factor [Polycladospora coralii]MBD1373071.1 response regulator transcription factor [Polycladospora coralii]MBS7529583.1 response regulator transcription factor [Polycladospora coralii]
MTKARILMIEDESSIREVCKRYLEREGYEVYAAINGVEGLHAFLHHKPDLVILDLMMPEKDGWQLCEEIRLHSDVPIMMLTARGEERDRILGLTIGADDYLTKPFSPRELVLRVQVILRRMKTMSNPSTSSQILQYPDLKIDMATRRVEVYGNELELTVKEFDLLLLLAQHPRQVFSRMQLLDRIWGSTYEGDRNVVTVIVSRLREKLEQNPSKPRWVHTVWGIGYRFEPTEGEEL